MTVRLYDSRTQAVTDFIPLVAGRVGIYVCGPTVQSGPHIGHLRSALVYDIWTRWLRHRDYHVTLVRNVTDVDDKILANAQAAGDNGDSDVANTEPWWALAYRIELEFTANYQALGVLPPTYEPRATASVQQMQDLIAELIATGHAYAAADESGDVYFDTASWPAYGELTRQRADDMAATADSDPRAKRDPRDFALWKGTKPHEPASASWAAPWGAGRPGWHIECSAMAGRYLGDEFDIHGGGLDLRFPHHENELAQSTAAGRPFARYWVHNGLVDIGGQKMSKSLGNSLMASEMLRAADPLVVRYYLGAAHYRSTLDYHDGVLAEAEAALERIEVFLSRSEKRLANTRFTGTELVPEEFAAAMDEDLAVPQALAVLHDRVRAGNAALDDDDLREAARARGEVVAMTEVLGINPLSPHWQQSTESKADDALDVLVGTLLAQRDESRSRRDFAAADRIRDGLAAAGIRIEDGPSGSSWSLE